MADGLIIDNKPSLEYFREKFGVDAAFITYGADPSPPTRTSYLEDLGVEPRGYVLFVGALVSDKGPDLLVEAYRRIGGDMPCLIVGDTPFEGEYKRDLRRAAADDHRIRMLGYVYGNKYRELVVNSAAYVHPLRSDGTSPALLQAMALGSAIVVNSVPEALSAVGDAALPFSHNDVGDLARQLERVISDPELAEDLRVRARSRARKEYDWNTVADAHARVFVRLANPRARLTPAVS
jgi:glycosyltransferase involved in cell wall biosynthesis